MIRKFVSRFAASALVLAAMACVPVQGGQVTTIGDNVNANSGIGFVLMVSIKRGR